MLSKQIALVTGASRGLGRGIAVKLAEAGATVYATALSPENEEPMIQSWQSKLPTLDDLGNEIRKFGGQMIPVTCDHRNSDEVGELFKRISMEQNDQLDIVVSNAFSAVSTVTASKTKKFFELPIDFFDCINDVGLRGHYICLWNAAKVMSKNRKGLMVITSSPGGLSHMLGVAYGVNKAGCDKMAADVAVEMKEFNVACLSLWTTLIQSELIMNFGLAHFGNEMWAKLFNDAPNIYFPGKCVVALATDKNVIHRSGEIVTECELAKRYGLRDDNGGHPSTLADRYENVLNSVNAARKTKIFTFS